MASLFRFIWEPPHLRYLRAVRFGRYVEAQHQPSSQAVHREDSEDWRHPEAIPDGRNQPAYPDRCLLVVLPLHTNRRFRSCLRRKAGADRLLTALSET